MCTNGQLDDTDGVFAPYTGLDAEKKAALLEYLKTL